VRFLTRMLDKRTRAAPADDDFEQPSLSPIAIIGTGDSLDQSFWLTPLPPAGPLEVVCSWPAHDIPESRTVLDGAVIAQAASRAEVLWPPPQR
jgi:hypothetical protein